jgi:hypothetical protein
VVNLRVCLQGAGLVSEFTTCWALVSLTRCTELSRQLDISVPLYTGSIYQPVSCCNLALHQLQHSVLGVAQMVSGQRGSALQATRLPAGNAQQPFTVCFHPIAYCMAAKLGSYWLPPTSAVVDTCVCCRACCLPCGQQTASATHCGQCSAQHQHPS